MSLKKHREVRINGKLYSGVYSSESKLVNDIYDKISDWQIQLHEFYNSIEMDLDAIYDYAEIMDIKLKRECCEGDESL